MCLSRNDEKLKMVTFGHLGCSVLPGLGVTRAILRFRESPYFFVGDPHAFLWTDFAPATDSFFLKRA